MRDIGHKHQPANWRLFIDSNKLSLKAVFLQDGNEYLSIRNTVAFYTPATAEHDSNIIMLKFGQRVRR